eukprot:CAMPEP_0184872762 /NCGR_PEP_ID=MMETSP0580-20130426/41470_1 /TAXON_ID=1118495 /ORGANISM="Dactyliosolen fragilissimus" /LENGTH=787 /DNA_ID=CAMNT_0027375603 /DNA_START=551 /DNA_END=2914 /DNA_ORIENTATION=-
MAKYSEKNAQAVRSQSTDMSEVDCSKTTKPLSAKVNVMGSGSKSAAPILIPKLLQKTIEKDAYKDNAVTVSNGSAKASENKQNTPRRDLNDMITIDKPAVKIVSPAHHDVDTRISNQENDGSGDKYDDLPESLILTRSASHSPPNPPQQEPCTNNTSPSLGRTFGSYQENMMHPGFCGGEIPSRYLGDANSVDIIPLRHSAQLYQSRVSRGENLPDRMNHGNSAGGVHDTPIECFPRYAGSYSHDFQRMNAPVSSLMQKGIEIPPQYFVPSISESFDSDKHSTHPQYGSGQGHPFQRGGFLKSLHDMHASNQNTFASQYIQNPSAVPFNYDILKPLNANLFSSSASSYPNYDNKRQNIFNRGSHDFHQFRDAAGSNIYHGGFNLQMPLSRYEDSASHMHHIVQHVQTKQTAALQDERNLDEASFAPPVPHSQHLSKETGTTRSTEISDSTSLPRSPKKKSSTAAKAAIAAGMTLPSSASEVNFDIRNPPLEPVLSPSSDPICTIQSAVKKDDVLCGRGGGTNTQIGNRRFRHLVHEFQPTYLLCRRKEKPLIARTIVLIIRNRGGRFLKKDEQSGMLYEVGDEKAEAKTSQALREGLDVRATKTSTLLGKTSNKMKSKEIQSYNDKTQGRGIKHPEETFKSSFGETMTGPSLQDDEDGFQKSSFLSHLLVSKKNNYNNQGDFNDIDHQHLSLNTLSPSKKRQRRFHQISHNIPNFNSIESNIHEHTKRCFGAPTSQDTNTFLLPEERRRSGWNMELCMPNSRRPEDPLDLPYDKNFLGANSHFAPCI